MSDFDYFREGSVSYAAALVILLTVVGLAFVGIYAILTDVI